MIYPSSIIIGALAFFFSALLFLFFAVAFDQKLSRRAYRSIIGTAIAFFILGIIYLSLLYFTGL